MATREERAARKQFEEWRREREKQRKTLQEEHEEAQEAEAWRIEAGLTMLGEIRAGSDASTVHEALVAALRFSKAYGLDAPVRIGDTSLLDLERRLFYEAARTKRPWLCPDGTLSEMESKREIGTFQTSWVPLPGSELPISQEAYDKAMSEVAVAALES